MGLRMITGSSRCGEGTHSLPLRLLACISDNLSLRHGLTLNICT